MVPAKEAGTCLIIFMKRIIVVTLFSVGLIGCAERPTTDKPITRDSINSILDNRQRNKRQPSPVEAEVSHAFTIEKAADVVVVYSARGTMELLPPRTPDGVQPNPNRDFPPNQLIDHFDSQARKKLVVVIINKQTWSEKRLKSEIAGLNRYFFSRGYQRVVIQQALGNGRPTHSDLQRPSTS